MISLSAFQQSQRGSSESMLEEEATAPSSANQLELSPQLVYWFSLTGA